MTLFNVKCAALLSLVPILSSPLALAAQVSDIQQGSTETANVPDLPALNAIVPPLSPVYCNLTICFKEVTLENQDNNPNKGFKETNSNQPVGVKVEEKNQPMPQLNGPPTVNDNPLTPPTESTQREAKKTLEQSTVESTAKEAEGSNRASPNPVPANVPPTNAAPPANTAGTNAAPAYTPPTKAAPTNTPPTNVSPANTVPAIKKADAPKLKKANPKTNTSKPAASEKPKAPGLFEVDEDAATRALERSLVSINALLLQSRQVEASLDFSMAYDLTKHAELIEIDNDGETTNTVGEIENIRTLYSTHFSLAFGLPGDAQVRLQLPLQHTKRESNLLVSNNEIDGVLTEITGIGDATLSLAKTIAKEKGRRPDIIAQVTYDTDWGATKNNIQLGDNLQSVELGIRATKRQDPLVFTYGVSHTIPIEKNNFTAGAATRFSASTLLAASPYTSLIFSFNHTFIASASLDGQTIRGSKGIDSSANIGISSVIGIATFMSAGVVAGLTEASNDYSAYISMSKRFSF